MAVVLLVELLQLGHLFDRFLYRERKVRLVGNHLRNRIRLGRREAQHTAHVLDGRARLERAKGDDLPDAVAPVLGAHVLEHFAAPLFAEIHVDVGHRHTFRIQEALEQQVELERAHISDAERVAHQRAGRRAAARPHRDAPVACGLDEVCDDQDVAGVAGLGDNAEFEIESLFRVRGERRAVAFLGAGGREFDEEIVFCFRALGEREGREMVLLGERDVHLVGDRQRVFQDFSVFREVLTHFGPALEVEPVVVAHPVEIETILLEPDAEQHVVRVVILGAEEV